MRNNINYYNYNNINNEFNGSGIDNDPFDDSFFKFPGDN